MTDWPDICTLRTSPRKKRRRSQVRASAQHRLKKGIIFVATYCSVFSLICLGFSCPRKPDTTGGKPSLATVTSTFRPHLRSHHQFLEETRQSVDCRRVLHHRYLPDNTWRDVGNDVVGRWRAQRNGRGLEQEDDAFQVTELICYLICKFKATGDSGEI